MKFFIAAIVSAVVAAAAFAGLSHAASGEVPSVTDSSGQLHVPDRYRETYEFLGSWAIANDKGEGSKDIHQVYASPGAVAAFKKDGHFPNGTVLVKEVYTASTAKMTTGTASHPQTLQGWFVMVRDTKEDHPGNKLWGDGWGWSWFDAGNPVKTTSTDYKVDCQGCHVPAKANDWIYTEGYPALKNSAH